jgi:hypothetical protein
MFCRSLFVHLSLFFWPLYSMFLLRFMDFDYPSGKIKLFLKLYVM